MKRIMGMVIGVIAVTFALTLSAPQVSAEKSVDSNQAIAKVNGKAITEAELDRSLSVAKQRAAGSGRPLNDEQLAQLRKQTIEKLIGTELLFQASEKEGIEVDKDQVSKRFEEWKSRFPNDAAYEKMLKELDVTQKDVKSEIKRGLAIQKLIDERFKEKTNIPEKDIRAFYDDHPDFFKQPEQVKARHILIKVNPDGKESEKEEALKKIEEIQKKQKDGQDFAELAKEYSEGPSSKKGGDLGYFNRQQMVKPFSDAAFGLNPGEVSDVVKTRFGYHLIKVDDKKPATTAPYDSVKEKIGQYLKQQKMQKEIAQYVKQLKEEGNVEIISKAGS